MNFAREHMLIMGSSVSEKFSLFKIGILHHVFMYDAKPTLVVCSKTFSEAKEAMHTQIITRNLPKATVT